MEKLCGNVPEGSILPQQNVLGGRAAHGWPSHMTGITTAPVLSNTAAAFSLRVTFAWQVVVWWS